jgi:uncharacterized membrane protein YphA (DoxX/SURF4 family)
MSKWAWLFRTSELKAIWIIRLLVGGVFLSEGIQKFLFPSELGFGRFLKIGLPAPEFLAGFVGVTEITGGVLILFGLLVRPAAVALIVDMIVALLSTKVPILLHEGFWKAAHEARTDISMLLGCLFILMGGAGRWSFDDRISKRRL